MRGRFVFEAAGNPKDAITNFLNKVLEDIKKFEGIEIKSHEIAEPIEKDLNLPNGQKVKIWSTYMEIEAEFKDLDKLLQFILTFSPSMIEIDELRDIKIAPHDFNKYLNEISHRIIQLSMIINDLNARSTIFANALNHIRKNNPSAFKSLPENIRTPAEAILTQMEQAANAIKQNLTKFKIN